MVLGIVVSFLAWRSRDVNGTVAVPQMSQTWSESNSAFPCQANSTWLQTKISMAPSPLMQIPATPFLGAFPAAPNGRYPLAETQADSFFCG
ncbi:MAG TPA: hypothetical protein DCX54_08680 [Flavobacteriales bacterium]|nr:hypothetical protein [Flavobacteriales bacterium]